MLYFRLIALVAGLALHFVYVYGQNATIYGVIGNDISPISPLPTAKFLSQYGSTYVYNVLTSTSITVCNVPDTPYTKTFEARNLWSYFDSDEDNRKILRSRFLDYQNHPWSY
ncbi:hypothetical protein DL96DRAFT_481979 [Flagelloscypha sp. PMI_526]|nr:hypothetical protein DL96DRAFT_481979 [Flagelloscypha sp. PMI_526]